MIINLNVKVKGGPRTPVDVEVYGTAVDTKTITFANGKQISETELAESIVIGLMTQLRTLQCD